MSVQKRMTFGYQVIITNNFIQAKNREIATNNLASQQQRLDKLLFEEIPGVWNQVNDQINRIIHDRDNTKPNVNLRILKERCLNDNTARNLRLFSENKPGFIEIIKKCIHNIAQASETLGDKPTQILRIRNQINAATCLKEAFSEEDMTAIHDEINEAERCSHYFDADGNVCVSRGQARLSPR